MATSGLTFVGVAALSALCLHLGWRWSNRSAVGGRMVMIVALTLLVAWAWLSKQPAVAVRVLPLEVLGSVEGVGAVPLFMALLGAAWARASRLRQRRVAGMAVIMGVVYFVSGGLWMLQSTPATGFASEAPAADGVALQSQEFSCVPAACATALTRLGVPTSEAVMAELTQTRPGTGATLLRAAEGLRERLAGTGWGVVVLRIEGRSIDELPMPLLTPLRFEAGRRHMVAVLGSGPRGIEVADPNVGRIWFDKADLLTYFTGDVIAFERTGR